MTSLDEQLHELFRSAESPVDDLPGDVGPIRTRVRRRQLRQRGAAVLAAAAVVIVAGVVLAQQDTGGSRVDVGPGDPATTTTGEGHGRTQTTTSAPSTSSSTEIPPPGAPTLKPPDSPTPAAGTCAEPTEPVVEVVIHPDIPSPRCTRVTAGQRLQVRNDTDQPITVSLADLEATLAPGQAQLFDRAFAEYLAPGVHRVTVPLYGTSGPEVWLVG